MNLDWQILHAIQQHLVCPFLDTWMPRITALGNGGLIWILAALGLLCTKKYRKHGALLLGGLALGVIIGNGLLKHLVARPRPAGWTRASHFSSPTPRITRFPRGTPWPPSSARPT